MALTSHGHACTTLARGTGSKKPNSPRYHTQNKRFRAQRRKRSVGCCAGNQGEGGVPRIRAPVHDNKKTRIRVLALIEWEFPETLLEAYHGDDRFGLEVG